MLIAKIGHIFIIEKMKRDREQWKKFWREQTVKPNIPPPMKWFTKVAEAIQKETRDQIAAYVRTEAAIYGNKDIEKIAFGISDGNYLSKK
jgi:L-arabinose isomerase